MCTAKSASNLSFSHLQRVESLASLVLDTSPQETSLLGQGFPDVGSSSNRTIDTCEFPMAFIALETQAEEALVLGIAGLGTTTTRSCQGEGVV